MADFVDFGDAVGRSEDGGEVVAAGLAGEAFDLEGGSMAGDFKAVVGEDFFNVGDGGSFRVILDGDGF